MPAQRLVTAEDLYDLQFVEDPQISPDGRQVAFVRLSLDRLENKYRRHIWLAQLGRNGAPGPVLQFTFGPKSDTTPRWSPDGRQLAFVSTRGEKPQIHLISLDGGEAWPLTALPNGASGPAWGPDGRQLACLSPVNAEERRREDSGRSEPPPATAFEARQRKERQAEAEKMKADPRVITRLPYRSGTEFYDDRRQHIYVMDVPPAGQAARPRRITDGDVDFGGIAWAPDGRFIFSTLSRQPDYDPWFHLDVVRLPTRGRRAPRRYAQPGYECGGVRVSPDGEWIAFTRTEEAGTFGSLMRLAVMPARGGRRAVRDLTLAFDRDVFVFEWSADSRWLYFLAEDRGDAGVYRVSVEGGEVEQVAGSRRSMVLGFSLDRRGQVAFVASTPERPPDVYLVSGTLRRERRLTDFNRELLSSLRVARTEEMRFKAPDGYELQGWLIRPPGHRPGRKVPLVVHVHGGPHVMWGPGTPSMWIEWQLHAARGYAVFYCNPRGALGYGQAHAEAIQGNWGDLAMGDILAGVDAVVARGVADPGRMALTGGSYAGYMTAWIVGHDRRFACAWAQRGLYNLLSWYGTTDVPQLLEREYGRLAADDVDRYWRHSPLAYVRQIRTPLAIEHQDQDYRCPVSDAEQLFTALQRLKRTVAFYRYPREGHEMSRSGEPQHRVDRLNRMVAWFDRYCMRRRR